MPHIQHAGTIFYVCMCAHGYNKSNGVLGQTWGGSTQYSPEVFQCSIIFLNTLFFF